MTADRARGALAVLQDADGKFICEVPCGYIVEQTASAHKPRRIQAQRRRRAMLRRRVALTVALLTVAALLAALMPWSGSGAADKPKDTTAGTLEEVHQPTAVLLPSSGTVAEYVPNAAEVEALAKLIYGEAGIVPSTTEQAAVVWCVLNRVDDPRFPDTVLEVIEAPYQFSGYDPEYPMKEEFALLAADVLTRYRAERDGEENVGRVLPAEYCFFTGDGARRCYFSFEEEQLVISNRMKSTSYPYEQFGVIYETAERFYFYINAYNGYILEKSGIRNGSADQLREFLNSRREDAVETIELS